MKINNKKTIFIFLLCLTTLSVTLGYFYAFLKQRQLIVPEEQSTEIKPSESGCVHYSFLSRQPDFFDASFGRIEDTETGNPKDIKGLVVNHHLLADSFVAEAFSSVASEQTRTVVILSPDHFYHGKGIASSTKCDWKTAYGLLDSDDKIIDSLSKQDLVEIDPDPFKEEHGIFNLVSFVKKVLPNAKIVPIITKDNQRPESSYKLAEYLHNTLPSNSLIVASVDFTHELPGVVADFHDAKTISALSNFDYSGLDYVDVDSKPTLRTLLKYLDLAGADNFVLQNNSNSAKLLSDPAISDATSYITGYFSIEKKERVEQATVLSFGDLMLDRYVRQTIDEKGVEYVFGDLQRFLGGSDIVLANLEGSFTDFSPKAIKPNNLFFTFEPNLVPDLKEYGFNIFNLANNHALNFGQEGLSQSVDYLEKSEIDYFGHPQNSQDLSFIKEIRGQKIGFVGYHQLPEANFSKVVERVKSLKGQVDWLIVYTHWGAEYQDMTFSSRQQSDAHKLANAGADIIIGSHPHVIQPIEIYNNKVIFYSLGNFVFDQTFSQETMQGLGVGLVLGKKWSRYYLFPIDINGLKPRLMKYEKSGKILEDISNNSLLSKDIKKQILSGTFVINQ